MNSRYSPLVTSRLASACGARNTEWRGVSQSNAKPAPSWPISHRPASPVIKASANAGPDAGFGRSRNAGRSEEHTSELQSLMRNSYAVFCLKKNNNTKYTDTQTMIRINIIAYQNMYRTT